MGVIVTIRPFYGRGRHYHALPTSEFASDSSQRVGASRSGGYSLDRAAARPVPDRNQRNLVQDRLGGGSGYEQAQAKLRRIESDEVAVAFGPPA
jgi:hypothetical protein